MPVLLPLRWEAGFPVLGRGEGIRPGPALEASRTSRLLGAIVSSDDFLPVGPDGRQLKMVWEWNHSPRPGLWRVDPERGGLVISTDRLAENPTRALNTLTQRSVFPACSASVRVDASALRDGDFAGICALQGRWAMAAVTREGGRYFAVMIANPGEAVYEMGGTPDLSPGVECARVPLPGPVAELRASLDFRDLRDLASFQLYTEGQWLPLGPEHRLRYGLDHFTGCRFGLCHYSTRHPGGQARFGAFRYSIG
jgi:beta-xylosidase